MARKYAAIDSDMSNNRTIFRKGSSDTSYAPERTWIRPSTPAEQKPDENIDKHLKHLDKMMDDTFKPKEIASIMMLKNGYRELHDLNSNLYKQTIYHNGPAQQEAKPLPYKTNEISAMLFDRWTETITQKYSL